VITGEKIKITDESLNKIARLSGGSFRDAIKILEQFTAEGQEYLDRYNSSELDNFIDSLIKKDEKSAISEIEKNVSNGTSVELFLSELLEIFHKAILAESGIGEEKLAGLNTEDLIELTDLFTQANKNLVDSPVEELPVEIAVIKWCGEKDNRSQTDDTKVEEKKVESALPAEKKEFTQESVGVVNDDIWKKILSEIHPVNASIEGLLRASRPVGYDGKTLTLGVFYKFHKERLEDINHKKILEDVIAKVLNSPTRIICTLVEPPPKEPVLTESKDNDIIKAAEEIFGS
jgi:DNA polymerase III gamma/tau subunit